uniref:Zinc finger transcription factor Sp5 n=1 Tax=Meridionale flava TaxID=2138384 RepID=A0A2R4FYD5_9CHEL|nr:zinc finger transcription factor Sp5 [Meridionale flava]
MSCPDYNNEAEYKNKSFCDFYYQNSLEKDRVDDYSNNLFPSSGCSLPPLIQHYSRSLSMNPVTTVQSPHHHNSPIESASFPVNSYPSTIAENNSFGTRPSTNLMTSNRSYAHPQFSTYPHRHAWCSSKPNTSELSLRATAMVDPSPRLHLPAYPHVNVATVPTACDYTRPSFPQYIDTPRTLSVCDYAQPASNSHIFSSPVLGNADSDSYSLNSVYFYSQTSRKMEKCRCQNCIDAEKTGNKKILHVCSVEGCEKVYKKTSHLKAHIRSHNGIRPFRCNWISCMKSFTRSDELLRHKRIHTGTKNFSCDTCGKKFVRSDHHKKHVNTHKKKQQPTEENIDVLND